MEESTDIRECRDAGTNHAVFEVEKNGASTIRQEQMAQGDNVLKSISPLINSMRPFGLYFARKARVECEQSDLQVRKCRYWNFARVHATVILVVAWLNALRFSIIFDGKETVGAVLFMKLGIIPAALLNIILQTTYYVASHTGTLDRVIRQADSELSPKYRRRTKVVTVVCWLLAAWNAFHYIYQLFTNGRLNDLTLIVLNRSMPELYMYVVKAVLIMLQLQTIGTWLFPQAMKSTVYIYCSSHFFISLFLFLLDKSVGFLETTFCPTFLKQCASW